LSIGIESLIGRDVTVYTSGDSDYTDRGIIQAIDTGFVYIVTEEDQEFWFPMTNVRAIKPIAKKK
jgi:hypothetical protein